jgi:hypothetical protein
LAAGHVPALAIGLQGSAVGLYWMTQLRLRLSLGLVRDTGDGLLSAGMMSRMLQQDARRGGAAARHFAIDYKVIARMR